MKKLFLLLTLITAGVSSVSATVVCNPSTGQCKSLPCYSNGVCPEVATGLGLEIHN
jgi:hypothetical protein